MVGVSGARLLGDYSNVRYREAFEIGVLKFAGDFSLRFQFGQGNGEGTTLYTHNTGAFPLDPKDISGTV